MMKLDYFYDTEAESFRFYQIPALLLEEKEYRDISDTAKILYGVLLSRLALSRKNRWIEEKTGRLYISYNLKQLVEMLGRSDRTISKAMKQLAEVGLIEKKKRGQGKTDIIYVMNFTRADKTYTKEAIQEKKTENGISERTDIEEVSEENGHQNGEFRSEEITILKEEQKKEVYRKKIKQQLEYNVLIKRHQVEKEIIDAMIEILTDIFISGRKTYKISGDDIPANEVQNRIKRLNIQHIEYIIECLNRNTKEIRRPDNYLLTSLYNAPITIGLYYKAQVQHDWKMENISV